MTDFESGYKKMTGRLKLTDIFMTDFESEKNIESRYGVSCKCGNGELNRLTKNSNKCIISTMGGNLWIFMLAKIC